MYGNESRPALYFIPSPEHIARSSRLQINFLTLQDPTVIDGYYPGFSQGYIFDDRYKAEGWVPEDRLLDSIQFAGTGSYEGIRKYLVKRLEDLNRSFTFNPFSQKYERRNLDPDTIFGVMKYVEDFMQNKKRRSGEPAMTHIYRVTLRVLDMIEEVNKSYSRGEMLHGFDSEQINKAVLVAFLHDFIEDDIEDPVKNESRKGSFYAISSSDEPNTDGFYLRQNITDQSGSKHNGSEYKIPMHAYDMAFFSTVLKSLNTDREGVDITHSLQAGMYEVDHYQRFDAIQKLIALFVKMADRQDNLATIGFTYKNGVIMPEDKERVKRKAIETIHLFTPLEQEAIKLFRFFAWVRPNQNSGSILGRLTGVINNIQENGYLAKLDNPLLGIFPTRVARQMLLGLNLNQIYHTPLLEGVPKAK